MNYTFAIVLYSGALIVNKSDHAQPPRPNAPANEKPQASPLRILFDLGKYLLAIGLLVWVVRANWSPAAPPRAVAALAASSVGLASGQPLLAAAAAVPGRTEALGLGYVWQHHLVQGEPVNAAYLGLAFVLFCMAVFLTFVRWYMLVRALDLEIGFGDAIRYGLIGLFFNTFLPGAVGGDIIKAAALASGQKRRAAAVATVLMDRAIALWALVWFVTLLGGACWALGLLDGPAHATASFIISVAATIAAITAAVWLLIGLLPDHRAERFAGRLTGIPGVGSTLAEFWRAAWMYRQRQGTVALSMLITWAGQIGFATSFYLGLLALWSPVMGGVPSFAQHLLLVPMGVVMQALIPTPGGAGGGEWGFGALYLLFRAAEANGVLASLVQRLFTWLLGLLGYGVYLWFRPAGAVQPELPAQPVPPKPAQAPRALAG